MRFVATSLAVLATLALTSVAVAQIPADRPVDEVRLVGLERVSEQLVRAQLEVQTGTPLNPRAVSRDITRLFELGRFSDIRVERDLIEDRLVVTYFFEEERFIEEVKIIGNSKVRDRDVRSVLSWKEGDSFSEDAYDEEREAILSFYRSKGFLNASVDILVEEVASARVSITYVLAEGRKARIRSIAFQGNDVLSDRHLRKLIKTKRAKWFLGGKYDENIFEGDLRAIVDEYGNYGRLEADVAGTEFEYAPKGKRLDITVNVVEGAEYRVDSLDVAENIVFDDDEIFNSVKVFAGDVHNKGQVSDDAQAIREGYEDAGYVNAIVAPQVTLDRENKTTHIVHQVNEGDLKYVREIKISGNTITKDEVIRRWTLLTPGERYDGALRRASENLISSSGYFESSRTNFENILENDRFINLLVDVEEARSTGSFNFGAGYNTDSGAGGFVEIELNNFDITNWPSFEGGGQRFEARFDIGDQETQFGVSFTEPEFMGYPFSFGIDLFDERIETSGGSDYTEKTQGGQVRVGKRLSPYVTANAAFGYTDVEISDLFLINPQLRELHDPGTTVSTTWGITRNTLDRYLDPTKGAVHSFSIQMAGFGGDNDFVKLQQDSTWYRTLDPEKKWILSFRTRNGVAETYGGTDLVPLNDRFFAGGTSTIRGFDSRDVGPKARSFILFGEQQAIGGELRILNSLEAKYKFSDLLRFYAFVDSGGVWLDPGEFDFGDIKYSVGVGIGVDVPRMGPMRLDYGYPLNPDGDQGSGRLHLQTSFRF